MIIRRRTSKSGIRFLMAAVVSLSVGLGACGASSTTVLPAPGVQTSAQKTEAAKTAFLHWNELARRGDKTVKEHLCTNPKVSENEAEPLAVDHPGFNVPEDLNVQVSGESAVADFLDRGSDVGEADDQDVFVNLVAEDGEWKVCRYQVTAPGGFG